MCPIPYYDLMRHSKDKKYVRYEMVRYARDYGVKPAAREFATTPKTVRKWLLRWEEGSLRGLEDQSRAPHHPAHAITPAQREEVLALKRKLPSWGAARMKRDFLVTLSEKAIRRIWREEGLLKRKKRKHRTKQDLRAVKARWRLGEQICVDTKDLDDIPPYWPQMRAAHLPVVQYTAREVVSGLQFVAYAQERSLMYATLFIQGVLAHLQRCGIPLASSRIQTDNGSEFIGSWNARAASSFTRAVEAVPGLTHTTIPPGAHTWQADVETVHRLIEDEFYEVEPFPSRRVFLAKAAAYTLWFNTVRRNAGKGHQSPWDIIHARDPTILPAVVALPPVFLEDLWKQQRKSTPGGDDVIPYP